jgi:LacI family transcriptional regulator
MTDVAELAGVSQTTVSFVMNDRADIPVAAATRRRILEAADRLGYRPNRAAQQLRSQRPATIGIVTRGIASSPFAGQTVLGAQRAAHDAGFVCMLVDVPESGSSDEEIANLVDQGIGGVLYASPRAGGPPVEVSRHLDGTRTVFSYCWPAEGANRATVILPDDRSGGRDAARMVFSAGHRDVAFVAGTFGEWSTTRRWEGLVDAAAEVEVDADDLDVRYGDYSTSAGRLLTLQLWHEGRRPTAIVAGNDRMALGCLLALHELGLTVPGDVSVVGFDDQEYLASELTPSLSTVGLPFWEMGYRAVRSLVDSNYRLPVGETFVDCIPVSRDSVRRLPASHI